MVGDFGGRAIPPGTVFWESPDVWVMSSAGINQPVVGEPNVLFGRVNNFGLEQANGIVVKFWWANPSVAITEASAHLVGITTVPVIPSRTSVVVQCPDPWIPVVENGGHECLLVEAHHPLFDPLVAPMDPVVDRHVGQKNEQLVTAEPGGGFEVVVSAANLAPLHQAVAFELHAVAAAAPALEARRLLLERPALAPASAPLALDVQVSPTAGEPIAPSAAFVRGLLALGPTEAGGGFPDPVAAQSVHLSPWESRTLNVQGTVPADAESGQTFMFRIVQRIGPVIAGGYSVVVAVA